MGYVLDTADLPAHERLEAVRAAMMYASAPCHVLHENPDGDVRARMEVWDFGAATIFTQRSTGIRLLRTAKLARQDEMPVVALAVQHRVDGRIEQHGRQRVVAPGELLVVDVSAPYDYAWSGDGGGQHRPRPRSARGTVAAAHGGVRTQFSGHIQGSARDQRHQ